MTPRELPESLPAGEEAVFNADDPGALRLTDPDTSGRIRAVNLTMPFRTWRGRVQRFYLWPWGVLIFAGWARFNQVERVVPFRALRVVHFLTFAMIHRLPYLGGGQAREQLKHSYQLLCSCFNGDLLEYLDVFSDGIPEGQLTSVLGDTPGFVKSRPVTRWKDWIVDHAFEGEYFYSAYPEASAVDVRASLQVARAIQDFDGEATDTNLQGPAFARELADLVRDQQSNLGRIATNELLEAARPDADQKALPIRVRREEKKKSNSRPVPALEDLPLGGGLAAALRLIGRYTWLLPASFWPIALAGAAVVIGVPWYLQSAGWNGRALSAAASALLSSPLNANDMVGWLAYARPLELPLVWIAPMLAPLLAASLAPSCAPFLALHFGPRLEPVVRPLLAAPLHAMALLTLGDATRIAATFALWCTELGAAIVLEKTALDMMQWVVERDWPFLHRRRRIRHHTHAVTALSPIVEGQTKALRKVLSEIPRRPQRAMTAQDKAPSPFERSAATHMLRFAILDRKAFARIGADEPVGLRNDYLLLHLIADAKHMNPVQTIASLLRTKRNIPRYLRQLHADAGGTLNSIYTHCVRFPMGAKPDDFSRYILRCRIGVQYTFRDARDDVPTVLKALKAQGVLRELTLLSQTKPASAQEYECLRKSYTTLVTKIRSDRPPTPAASSDGGPTNGR